MNEGCPCHYTTPCSYACSCAHPTMSGGCHRCATYGSLEQRKEWAERLAKIIDDGLDRKIIDSGPHKQKIIDVPGAPIEPITIEENEENG